LNKPPFEKETPDKPPFEKGGLGGFNLPTHLPPLREDLQLLPAACNRDGSPAWLMQDPISNTFYRLGWLEFELLIRWTLASPAAILAATATETLFAPTPEELAHLYQFLLQNQLLEIHDLAHTRELVARFRAAQAQRLKWLLHHYLFFRIPLFRPAAALQKVLPGLNWLFTRTTALTLISLSAIGLALTARQWEVFAASFVDTLSPSGLAGYLLALAVTKSLHELGHALTATRFGLRVAHMGIAFVVLWPMLYTDTGEAWRLANARHRLGIAAAGIITEMALAGLATLAWNLTDDADLKTALFFLATTSWILSLGLNLSPFMRFDGYFILSDWLDMPNLHERSFALARVALRNHLFGFRDPNPEPLPKSHRRMLIGFAVLTWLYRLIIFVGIAVAVYLYFFKLLGIFLFTVELLWFVVLPIGRELRVWHRRRAEVRMGRKVLLALGLSGLLALAVLPWQTQIRGNGYAHPAQTHVFYSPLAAQLVEIPPNPPFSKGGDEGVPFSKGGDESASFSKSDAISPRLEKADAISQRLEKADAISQRLEKADAISHRLEKADAISHRLEKADAISPPLKKGGWGDLSIGSYSPVKVGQPLFILAAPEQAYRTQVATAAITALDQQLRGLRGLDNGEDFRAKLEQQRTLHRAEIQAQHDESQRLVLTAHFDGVLIDIDPELAPGVWVNSKDALAVLIAPARWQVELFVDQADLTRLANGAPARFYPEDHKLAPMTGTVIDIAATRTLNLPENLLSSQYGGAIVTLPNTQQLTPRDALYRVRIGLKETPAELRMLRGAGVIEGQPESWLWNKLKPALIVLIRELSF
jgi:hypothetical protein